MRSWMLAVCVALGYWLPMSSCLAGGSVRTVALTGQPALGTNDNFGWVGMSVLSGQGDVTFRAQLASSGITSAPRYGLWSSSRNNVLSLIAPPDFPGYFDLVANDIGDVAYRGPLGLAVRKSDGSVRIVVGGSQPAVGISPPANFSWEYYFSQLSLNNAGDITFSGAAQPFRGLWRENAGTLELVAKSGDKAVGDPLGREFNHFSGPQINDSGQVLFSTMVLDHTPYPSNEQGGIFLANAAGEIKRIAGYGDQLNTDRGPVSVLSVHDYKINNSGYAAYRAELQDRGTTILLDTPDGVETLIADDDPLGDERIFYLRRFWLSSGRSIAYEAAMIGGNAIPNDTYMILTNSPGQIPTIVARTNAPAVDGDGDLWSSFMNFGSLGINSIGQVAFGAALEDPSNGAYTGNGIWAQDRLGRLRLVAKTGDQIDLDNGPGLDLRTVLGVGFGGGGSEYQPSFFNDRGELLFSARFSDGTEGLFVSNIAAIPEPATHGSLCLSALILATRRRNTRD